MTRARCVLGSGSDSNRWPQRFESVREAVITSDRDTRALRHEIALMRDRVGAAHPVREGRFDVKHSPGGMVDAEFAVQYLVLSHSAAHPALRDNVGNIALLARAETAGLLAPGTGVAAGNAYRELRRLQHQARLDEAPTQVVPASVAVYSAAIQAVWHQVLGPAGGSGPSRSHSTT
jgi:glutamate-ammonia-ligase adenylyltransferase